MTEKLSPFDYINNITQKGPELPLDSYTAFMVNRGLSYYKDCVFLANEMNRSSHIQADMQYSFLRGAISKGNRRFAKWAKADSSDENMLMVSEYFSVNHRRAKEILSLINKNDLEEIKNLMYKGGR